MSFDDHPLKSYLGKIKAFVAAPARIEGKWDNCVIPLRKGQRLHFIQDIGTDFFAMQLIPDPAADEAPTVHPRSVGPSDGGVVAAFLAAHCR